MLLLSGRLLSTSAEKWLLLAVAKGGVLWIPPTQSNPTGTTVRRMPFHHIPHRPYPTNMGTKFFFEEVYVIQVVKDNGVAVMSAKNHKRQPRKRQSVTAKREKSQTPKFVTAILT